MSRMMARCALAVATLACGVLCAAPSAQAEGSCGPDPNGSTACPLTASPITVSGTLEAASEFDYYVFSAQARTHLSLTFTNTQDPSCSTSVSIDCGAAFAILYRRDGDEVDNTESSMPLSGITQPETINPTIGPGIYYVAVGNGQAPFPIPYTLSINAATTPAVHWPPLCTVPRLRHDTSLNAARRAIITSYCVVGAIHHVANRSTRHGRVAGLAPRAGTVLPNGSRVTINVSGPAPRVHHRRHRAHRRRHRR